MDDASISVRTATACDASLLADLGARTFRDTFAADNTPSDMATYLDSAFSARIQAREIADAESAFLIADAGGSAVGYARIRQGRAPACVGGQRPLEIARFYADASWIGRGVGPALMQACLDEATSRLCDVVWLDVWERNPRAIAFYAKWSFVVVGEAEFALGNDVQHDLLMARPTG